MTLQQIEELDENVLSVKQVAEFLGLSPQLIRDEAGKTPAYLGFPICKAGHAFKIPKEGFLRWYRGELPIIQVVSSNELFRSFERSGL